MDRPTELCRMQVSEIQRRLAIKATKQPGHRFTKLYDLLTWEPLMIWAFETLLTNRGSRTAGIDGMDKRTVNGKREGILADLRTALKSGTYRPQPVRRAYIPKANGKRRPLGIPTLVDRLVQLMVKAILEPIFESDFRPESHGFRPQRSCHTAKAHLHQLTAPRQKKMHWIIEGDIVGCFDHIQHSILLRLLKRRVQDAKLVRLIGQMLKAGVMEGGLFQKTDEGTPQGGIVSPLLANIYLHELDMWFHKNYTGLTYNEKNRRRRHKEGNAFYVRYADDFVVAWNGTKEGAERLKTELTTFLHTHLGLDLSGEKTRITHDTDGYDFLGWSFKRTVSKRHGREVLTSYPSKKSVLKLTHKIKALTTSSMTHSSVSDKIEALNRLLRGWSKYFGHSVANPTFRYISHYTFKRMEIWLRSKTRQRVGVIYSQYYRRKRYARGSYQTWIAGGSALYVLHLEAQSIYPRYAHRPNPYLSPNQSASLPAYPDPYSGERTWGEAVYYGEDWPEIRSEVIRRDEYRCVLCASGQRIEVHHIEPYKAGMKHDLAKLVTLCATCHRKIRNPQSEASRQLARYHLETGEPDEAKVSRPVRGEA
jgi:RNA-directed DNA polymerase